VNPLHGDPLANRDDVAAALVAISDNPGHVGERPQSVATTAFMFYSRSMQWTTFETALGAMGIGWTDLGVARFQLQGPSIEERLVRHGALGVPPRAVGEIIGRVQRYAEGERVEFDDVALDFDGSQDFAIRVYRDILVLRWGETTTYGDIARRLGDVQLSRSVGQALGANPIPLIVPCHRVLAANGRHGGFSAPGGVYSKLRMLRLEQVPVDPPQMAFGF
jgi:methylated-DNA-[protein]-cysteine S-methyltransferase